jgi:hypothetical protein
MGGGRCSCAMRIAVRFCACRERWTNAHPSHQRRVQDSLYDPPPLPCSPSAADQMGSCLSAENPPSDAALTDIRTAPSTDPLPIPIPAADADADAKTPARPVPSLDVVAGSGTDRHKDGAPHDCGLRSPHGCCALAGTLYFADSNSHTIRAVDGLLGALPVALAGRWTVAEQEARYRPLISEAVPSLPNELTTVTLSYACTPPAAVRTVAGTPNRPRTLADCTNAVVLSRDGRGRSVG